MPPSLVEIGLIVCQKMERGARSRPLVTALEWQWCLIEIRLIISSDQKEIKPSSILKKIMAD